MTTAHSPNVTTSAYLQEVASLKGLYWSIVRAMRKGSPLVYWLVADAGELLDEPVLLGETVNQVRAYIAEVVS